MSLKHQYLQLILLPMSVGDDHIKNNVDLSNYTQIIKEQMNGLIGRKVLQITEIDQGVRI